MKKHNHQKATADYSAAIAIDPGNPSYFLSRGYVWSRQADHARAMADFDEAIRLAPNFAGAYISRGIEWEKDLQPDKAMADYQKAISLDPKATIAYECRGRIWKGRGEFDKAVANFADLAHMTPDDPLGHRELAWLLATCAQKAVRDGQARRGRGNHRVQADEVAGSRLPRRPGRRLRRNRGLRNRGQVAGPRHRGLPRQQFRR